MGSETAKPSVTVSDKPASWDGLFELYGKDGVPPDFLGPADRTQLPQDRDPFEGWAEQAAQG